MAKMFFVFIPVKMANGKRGRMFIGHRTTEAGAKKLVSSNLHLMDYGYATCLWYSYDPYKNVIDSGYFGIHRTGRIDKSFTTSSDETFLPTARKVIRGTMDVSVGTVYEI